MKRKQIAFTAYEILLEELDNFVLYNSGIAPNVPEAVRHILEEYFNVSQIDRQAYRDYVKNGRIRGNKSVTRKKGRKAIKLQIRKGMEKGQMYTLTEMAKLGDCGRRIAKDILDKYPEDFTVIHQEGTKAYKIMKKPKKKKKAKKNGKSQ